jgi:hypothetical protein
VVVWDWDTSTIVLVPPEEIPDDTEEATGTERPSSGDDGQTSRTT